MADYSNFKIETFAGINNSPIAPTSDRGGNGSYLIAKINQLVDLVIELKTRIEDLENNSSSTPIEDTSTPYTFPFFIESGSGSSWVGEAPATGTFTKYLIDNNEASTTMNLMVNGNDIIHVNTATTSNGTEFLFDNEITINSGDEVQLRYYNLADEVSGNLIIYIQE